MITIKRSHAFGDVLLTEPVLRYFSKFDKVNIISSYPEVFKNSDYVINGNYDIDYDLDKSYETNRNKFIVKAYFDKCGINSENFSIEELIPKFYVNTYDINSSYCVIHLPFKNTHLYRNLYTNFDLINYVKSKIMTIEITNHLLFSYLCSIIKNAKFFIGMDSSIAHIAQSYNIPSLIFMGNVNPEYRFIRSNQIFMYSYCENQFCFHNFEPEPPLPRCCDNNIYDIPKCCFIDSSSIINNIEKLL